MARRDRSGLQRTERVLIVAHGNTLRALVKCLDNVSAGRRRTRYSYRKMPVYKLDDKLTPLQRYYLGDPEKVKAAMAAVAAQGEKD